ncbi:MAG: MG2 domain-containing protein [Kiritimatiellae bacterium]|nr:MG2 domain-containing protein [Kiritimatiellia bacterium]
MKKSTVVWACVAVFTLSLAACSLAGFGWMYRQVRVYERYKGVSIVSHKPGMKRLRAVVRAVRKKTGLLPQPAAKFDWYVVRESDDIVSIAIRARCAPCDLLAANGLSDRDEIHVGQKLKIPVVAAAQNAAATEKTAEAPPQLEITGVEYGGGSEIVVKFSEIPDFALARSHVSVSPLRTGVFGVTPRRSWLRGDYVMNGMVISGDFAFRTNVTLRIRKGLPLAPIDGVPVATGALAEDYVYTFTRDDRTPAVRFADGGRYLPACGARSVALESVNYDSVQAEIRRVEPANVVQLLAREADRYYGYWPGGDVDHKNTEELSGEPTLVRRTCRNLLNEPSKTTLPVSVADGGPRNGIFLVAIGSGDKPLCDSEYLWDDHGCNRNTNYNPRTYRLVCVTDLGVSVRKSGDGVGVWVASLTSGRPVWDAQVDVYSAANVKVFSGRTGMNGWCAPKRVAAGEPFAVVVSSAAGDDRAFLALSDRNEIDETLPDGGRPAFLEPGECTGFCWTERGIYRHGEKIFFQLILRDGSMRAPKPFPVTLELRDPEGDAFAVATALPDATGAATCDGFSVPDDQPSGKWTIVAKLPGEKGAELGSATVKIEEFAPPQVRVKVAPDADAGTTNFAFAVSAEHFFGGPARALLCKGAVVFEDAPFAPEAWKGYSFGDEARGLKPNFERIAVLTLDDAGTARFAAAMPEALGKPKAMVRATCQGVVIEDGGRPAAARATTLLHHYPCYVGSTLTGWLRAPENGFAKIPFACVLPNGRRASGGKTLSVKLERVDNVYTYRAQGNGWNTWDCERVRSTVVENDTLETPAEKDAEWTMPVNAAGDYVITVLDEDTGASYSKAFYLSTWGDESIRAPLANPTAVAMRPDKAFYRAGETPRLIVKSPFAGHAVLSVMREKELYTEILELTNATSEIVLRPVAREHAPNLDVYLSVVQSVEASAKRLAARAHGQVTIGVRPRENELDVSLDAAVALRPAGGGADVAVDVVAAGACVSGAVATVTVVDESINVLTGEKTPAPVDHFALWREGRHPLFDFYDKMLPVYDDGLRGNGAKTGGDLGAHLLSRVSPVGSRRFKPLALWQADVPLANGRGKARFALPEFVGEVRVTAVVRSAAAAGAASIQKKVAPKLVAQPDAPRFVAPGDVYEATLPLHNRSGSDGEVVASVGGKTFRVAMKKDSSTNLVARLTAPAEPGHVELVYRAEGFGEVHAQTIELPVRPAVAWQEAAGSCREEDWTPPAEGRWTARAFETPVGKYEAALKWLADYPHGCLEQTASRIFPLVAAGGLLNTVVSNGAEYAQAGVRRVESMIRARNFVTWPDSSYEPWDPETSLYAAHFLVAAGKAGLACNPVAERHVLKLLEWWCGHDDPSVAVYASLSLALAGKPPKSGMLSLYDKRKSLNALDRARLALAFAEANDLTRAKTLLADAFEPQSVKEASFALMALLAADPDDARILPLVRWLDAKRDKRRFCWGTTGDNAHALVAIGSYFRAHPPKPGEKFVVWHALSLPKPEDVRDDQQGLFVERRYRTPEGAEADLSNLKCGDLLVCTLSITSDVTRVVNDLVIEDLFPGGFEPVQREINAAKTCGTGSVSRVSDWVLRHDARDDRMLVFSKRFELEAGHEAFFAYPVRVVSAGDFVLPGTSVEGMYNPELHARRAPGRVVVVH